MVAQNCRKARNAANCRRASFCTATLLDLSRAARRRESWCTPVTTCRELMCGARKLTHMRSTGELEIGSRPLAVPQFLERIQDVSRKELLRSWRLPRTTCQFHLAYEN